MTYRKAEIATRNMRGSNPQALDQTANLLREPEESYYRIQLDPVFRNCEDDGSSAAVRVIRRGACRTGY
jgi:hypothetical protein